MRKSEKTEATETRGPTRQEVETWLIEQGRELISYSDVSRALISNRRHRARSVEARRELREALSSLQEEGRVSLSPTAKHGRDGQPGTLITINEAPTRKKASPVDRSTQGEES